MRLPVSLPRLRPSRPEHPREDAVAGLVLGVQSVPDGLAAGLLAGVNPLAGLYGYLIGTIVGALAVSSTFMVVQGTGAMAIVIADVPAIHRGDDPEAALATLALLTGLAMAAAGLLKLGTILRFVSNAVMVGFINAVGINIVLGQLSNLTGYDADGPNRVVRAIDTVLSPASLHWQSVTIGVLTIALIIGLDRLGVGPLGLVVAIVATSALAPLLRWHDVAALNDLGIEVDGLPALAWPSLGDIPSLVIPALSLAFVGLVQGAGVSASFPNAGGARTDPSGDFIGQGVANVACSVLQGMPVGGSMSASSLNRAAGARSRYSALVAGLVIAVVAVAFGRAVGYLAMPALAGLLIVIGVRTVSPANLRFVWVAGTVQRTVMLVTFVLTMLIPLQYAVLVGVGVSVVLYVIRQANDLTIRRRVIAADGGVVEVDAPDELPAGEVVLLQPYGSLFFAAAPVFEAALPTVTEASRRSVVIVRLRGRNDLGTTFMEVLGRYAAELRAAGSKLVIVIGEEARAQVDATGLLDVIGPENIYWGDAWVGAAVDRAREDAERWIAGEVPDAPESG